MLDQNLVGAYLQGSFAVGDVDEASGVDFLVVLHRGQKKAHRHTGTPAM